MHIHITIWDGVDLTWYKMATEAEPTDVPAPPPEEQPIFTSRFGWGVSEE